MRRGGIAIVSGAAALAACFAKPGPPRARPGDGGVGGLDGADGGPPPDSPLRGSDARDAAAGLRHVFITATTVRGNVGSAMDLVSADGVCGAEATASGHASNWQAWLADTSGSPASRFNQTNGPFVEYDASNTQVAAGWAALANNMLAVPIVFDATGAPQQPVYVWTGTAGSGGSADTGGSPTAVNCNQWQNNGSADNGRVGYNMYSNKNWTYDAVMTCDQSFHLYCFEQ